MFAKLAAEPSGAVSRLVLRKQLEAPRSKKIKSLTSTVHRIPIELGEDAEEVRGGVITMGDFNIHRTNRSLFVIRTNDN